MMMDGLDHPKTLDLAARLDASIPQVIGHLELLWAFTAQKTPHGNIGKWPDGTIARAAQWTGDASAFVTALHEAGFIDACPKHRFIIHDWQEHSPRWVKSKLSRAGESFATPQCSAECTPDSSAESMPSHAKPSLVTSSDEEASPAEPDDLPDSPPDEEPEQPGPPACPHDRIISLYHETLPQLRQVREWNDTRRALLRTRWRESPKRQQLEWWRRYFEYVGESDFLMGRSPPKPGQAPFQVDLEWLIRPLNMTKIIEGKYHHSEPAHA